jgi:hypothetical protein
MFSGLELEVVKNISDPCLHIVGTSVCLPSIAVFLQLQWHFFSSLPFKSLWRCTHFKCTVQWLLVNSELHTQSLQSNFRTFPSSPKDPLYPWISHSLFPPQLQAISRESALCLSGLSVLDIPYKWNHTVFDLLSLAFSQHNVFKVEPYCREYRSSFLSVAKYCFLVWVDGIWLTHSPADEHFPCFPRPWTWGQFLSPSRHKGHGPVFGSD